MELTDGPRAIHPMGGCCESYVTGIVRAGAKEHRRYVQMAHGTDGAKVGPAVQHGERPTYMTESLVDIEENPDFLGRLQEGDRYKVIDRGCRRRYRAGDHLFRQGEPHEGIYVIESGRVRSYYASPSGKEITLAYWTPGDFVGGPQIFGGGCHMWSSVAVSDSNALRIAGDDLRDLIREIPDLAVAVIDGLVHKSKCYSALLQLIGTRQMRARLAHLLLTLAERHGIVDQHDGLLIGSRFTHDELASMIGATRQWVSATMDQFESAGLITRKGDHIVVADRHGLLERSH